MMLDQLMDFTRLWFGVEMPMERKRVDLAALCREAAGELEAGNVGRAAVRCRLPPEHIGVCDPVSMARVLSNLLGNALRHGSPERPIELSLREDGAETVLEVHNYGSPIPPEMIPVMFDPFRRAKCAAHEAIVGGAGLGLGLYITRGIVAAHGGRIEVRSTAEHGTTFIVRLPRAADEGAAHAR